MVETWRGAVGVVERGLDLLRRDAQGARPGRGRSPRRPAGFLICRSLVTSWSPGSSRSFASRLGAARRAPRWSVPWSVNWYWLLRRACPPIRIGRRVLHEDPDPRHLAPASAAAPGSPAPALSVALRSRLELDEDDGPGSPARVPPAADRGHEGLARWGPWPGSRPPPAGAATMASNEIPAAASVKPKTAGVLGREEPLGDAP